MYECVWCLALAAVCVQYHLADKVTDTASQSLRRLFGPPATMLNLVLILGEPDGAVCFGEGEQSAEECFVLDTGMLCSEHTHTFKADTQIPAAVSKVGG